MRSTSYPPIMRRLINELSKLPTIGEKSATRLAYHIVTTKSDYSTELAGAIVKAKEKIRLCSECFSLSESECCDICEDETRDQSCICVVEKPADVIAVEKSGGYQGLYHVLHGLWSPLKGVGPEATKMPELLARIKESGIQELVLATSSTVEGDATALYIGNAIADLNINVSRIAQGIPMGGELEYADELTLSHAFEGRRKL